MGELITGLLSMMILVQTAGEIGVKAGIQRHSFCPGAEFLDRTGIEVVLLMNCRFGNVVFEERLCMW